MGVVAVEGFCPGGSGTVWGEFEALVEDISRGVVGQEDLWMLWGPYLYNLRVGLAVFASERIVADLKWRKKSFPYLGGVFYAAISPVSAINCFPRFCGA